MKPLIVSRHAGTVEWLARRGITGEVVEHATPDAVRGRVVYGNLPLHLAALAAEVVAIDMPDLPRDVRGWDLTPEEMDTFGARMTRYRVLKVEES
ncbi:MAG: hypothetical protein KatS3mg051_1029 [Anaerolineae bacterium]|nr:MAG: hypothetical protein KatS3mg051_1029 [Anaerolineae bacterium]